MISRRVFVAGDAATLVVAPDMALDRRRIAMVHVSRLVEQLSKAGGVENNGRL